VPGDRLAFTVRVGGEDQAVRLLHRLGDVGKALRRRPVDLPRHGKIVVRPDGTVLRRQVADVAERGEYREVTPEILVDGLRLCGRFDDDDVHLILMFLLAARCRKRPGDMRVGPSHGCALAPGQVCRHKSTESGVGGILPATRTGVAILDKSNVIETT